MDLIIATHRSIHAELSSIQSTVASIQQEVQSLDVARLAIAKEVRQGKQERRATFKLVTKSIVAVF